jgi:hypothetical protein
MTSLNWRLAMAWTLQLILAIVLVVVVVATLVYGSSYLVSRDGTVEKEARAKAITDTRSTLQACPGERKFFEQEGEDDRLDLSFIALRDAWCVACNFRRIYFWEVIKPINLAAQQGAQMHGATFSEADKLGGVA